MGKKEKRKIKKRLRNINWTLLERSQGCYKQGGEYAALKWLKAYVEGRAGAEPKELFESALNRVGKDEIDNRIYLITLYRYIYG